MSQQYPQRLLFAFLWAEFPESVIVACGQCEKAGQNREMFRVRRGPCNKDIEFGQLLPRRIAALKSRSTFELAGEREQCAVGMVGRAEISQCNVRLTVQPLIKRARNVRLADTRLPGQHHNPALSQSDMSPPAQ